jgi:putative DNA primase/helicase
VTARFLYREHFEFKPQFKLWLVTNHRPRVDGDDDAIWRRLRLIPFEQSFRGREDPKLDETLQAELPGILRWAVEGCIEWKRDGLGDAAAVVRATREYREDEDTLGAFLAERCELGNRCEVLAGDLRSAYEKFCEDLGEAPLAANVLGQQLRSRGITKGGAGRRMYRGVTLA